MSLEQVLQEEFAGSFYDGLAADAAFAAFTIGRDVVTQEQRLKLFTVSDVLSLVGQPSMARLVMLPSLTDIRDKIQQNDREGVLLWGAMLTAAGTITEQEAAAISAVCQATEAVDVTNHEDARILSAFAGLADFPNTITREQFDAAWSAAGRA